MRDLKKYEFAMPPYVHREDLQGGTVRYKMERNDLINGEFFITGDKEVELSDFLVFEYETNGLYRGLVLKQGFIEAVKDDVPTPFMFFNDILTDGKRHVAIASCKKGTYDHLRIRFNFKFPTFNMDIYNFYTCTKEELPERFPDEAKSVEGYECIDILSFTNDDIPDNFGLIDGGAGVPAGKRAFGEIPFDFSGKMIRPAASPKENDELIRNITAENVKRRLCRPESRESRFEIPVGKAAKEVYFVLYLDGLMHERWGFCAPDPTILGSAQGEVMMPLMVNDIERYAVYVNYEDGEIDECFPENVKNKNHAMTGEIGVYGVKTKDKKIKSISFEDRMIDTDVSLCALTLNVDAPLVLSPMFPERNKGHEADFNYKGEFSLDGDTLLVKNGALYLELLTKDGLFVKKAVSGFDEKMTIDGALLKVRTKDGLIENFERVDIKVSDDAKITYRYENLYITVTIALTKEDGVALSMKAENRGDKISVGILFPVISDIKFNNAEDTWYFLPKYQNTESNGSAYVYEESAPSFPMQFMDIFSLKSGAGFAINTTERELKVRKYALIKKEGRVDAFIEYPDMYFKLENGEEFIGTETLLYTHKGDWRVPFKNYKNWLDSWYEPYKCQDKKWYREKFWLLAEIDDFVETNGITNFPVWYDKKNKKYNFNLIMDDITELYGETPDILHMWGWCWDEELVSQSWGNYGKEDYDALGGLENFKAALNDVKERTGAEISLYQHPTLLSKRYKQAEEFFPKYRVKTASGNYIGIGGHSYRMCHANETWRDYAIKNYPRVHEETGVNILYIDEFSLRVDNRCFDETHGHEVPSNLLKTDRNFISKLKDTVPEDLVLYGEYYAVDVNARYIDCNISYYILDSINRMIEQGVHAEDGSDIYGRVFTDLYRFAFPKIVQLILPMAMRNLSWQPLKATFFNGQAIYDSFWDAEESRGRKFMAKSFRIKKDYADCFSSDTPETMTDSISDSICVNKYPGEGRCLYALYNRSYHTFKGDVLAIPYKEGAKYFDVWNNCEAPFKVKDGIAYIESRVVAQSVGAIAEIY